MERLEVVTLFKQRIAQLEQQNEELRKGRDVLLVELAKEKKARHAARTAELAYRKRAGVRSYQRRRCVGCGIDLNLRTVGCSNCRHRHKMRKRYAELKAAA